MNFWFSVSEELLLNEEFIKSRPSDKLYYFALLHHLNLHEISSDEDFFKRDIDFAAALSYSEDTIRNARRKFQKLGWLDITSGFRTKRGQNVATTYHAVNWREIPKQNEGKRFIKFPHYDFEMMLSRLQHGRITHEDMVIYCYIICWSQLKGTWDTPFFISKKDLRKYSNIVKAVDCVERLSQVYVFTDDRAVFEYEDRYHNLSFKLRMAADPFEDEHSMTRFNEFMSSNKRRADDLVKAKYEKEIRKAESKGVIIDTSQLIDLFRELYKETYGSKKSPSTDYSQKRKLIELAEENGLDNVVRVLRQYFELPDEDVPNDTGSKYKTLARFTSGYDRLVDLLSVSS